ncbi:LysR substrate-binding domain-containing protein [Enterovibrio calviensis]|uniref:LysR substrate-binding domain-containing protein n=1 Tax=Enterovibrio calviensis TaxID=91359 RepID=UPI003734E5FD
MNHEIPPMNALVSFDAVIKTGTIAAAAQMLYVTPSAVSQRIKQLEAWFKAPLFFRHQGKLVLTEMGKQLAETSTSAFDQLLSATHHLRSSAASSEISVSALSSFAYLRLMDALPQFYALYPDLSIHLETDNTKVDFRSHSLDLAIRYTYNPSQEGLTFDKIADETVFPCASPALIEQLGTNDLKTLIEQSAMIVDVSPQLVNVTPGWQQWLGAHSTEVSDSCRQLRFNEYQFAMKTAIAGQGVILARSVLSKAEIERGELVRLSDKALPSASSYYLVSRKDVPLKPPAREFSKWFLAMFSEKN